MTLFVLGQGTATTRAVRGGQLAEEVAALERELESLNIAFVVLCEQLETATELVRTCYPFARLLRACE